MNKSLGTFMAAIPFALSFAGVAEAQPQAQADKIPVKLLVVISTFEGDKKVSSMPYTLLATANGSEVSFNSGSNVPIPDGTGGNRLVHQYRNNPAMHCHDGSRQFQGHHHLQR